MRVYACHPMTAYGTDLERRQLRALRRHFPRAELVDPSTLWSSNDEWLTDWPRVCTGLDVLAVFADEEGMIGAGCLLELADAISEGLPVVALDQAGELRHFGGFERGSGLWVPPGAVGKLLFGPAVAVLDKASLRRSRAEVGRPIGA